MKLLLLWEIVMVFSSCRPIQFVVSSLTLGARVQFSLTQSNVNTTFLQVLTPEFGHSALAQVPGLDFVLGH